MTRKLAVLVCLVSVAFGALFAGTINKKKMLEVALPNEQVVAPGGNPHAQLPPPPTSRPAAGTYTGLQGYFDFQVNVGVAEYIRVDPSDATGSKIHIIFMTASDSTTPTGTTRATSYSYSTNGGQTWNNFGHITVPGGRRSGYPSLDMLQGSTQGTIIANHNVPSSAVQTGVYVDSPPGAGAFSELNSPPLITGGSDEPIWPVAAGTADGSIVVSASKSTANTSHYIRTTDFTNWSAWGDALPPSSAGLPTKANGTGKVAILLNPTFNTAADSGLFVLESTNNGATWPTVGRTVVPNPRIAGPDTFGHTLGSDLVYSGNNYLLAFAETNNNVNVTTDSAQITFWSQATGFVVAASKRNTPGVSPIENRATLNTVTMDMPSIGLSGSTIIIAYQAMMNNDTSANGYNCNDIFIVTSGDGGHTWSTPRNVTNTRGVDERFVCVSPWNEAGHINLVWQEKPEAGGQIIGDPGANVRLVHQVFAKLTITGVESRSTLPSTYALAQNYPNPFNPGTRISYSIPVGGQVSLKVYNMLGQEVATLANDYKPAGSYEANFSASNLASGVYYYTLKANSYSETRKMVLLK